MIMMMIMQQQKKKKKIYIAHFGINHILTALYTVMYCIQMHFKDTHAQMHEHAYSSQLQIYK